jgi:uncharacterized protein YxeA
MNKKKKIIIIVVLILLILLIGIGIYLFINYNGDTTNSKNNSDNSSESTGVASAMYDTPDDVLEVINEEYLGEGEEVYYSREEDDCWYFETNVNKTYSYCPNSYTLIVTTNDEDENID